MNLVVVPARVRHHEDKLRELERETRGLDYYLGVQYNLKRNPNNRNKILREDIEVIREVSSREVFYNLDFEAVNSWTPEEYNKIVSAGQEELQNEFGATAFSLFGYGLGRFSEEQLHRLRDEAQLLWYAPNFYQWHPQHFRDYARDISMAKAMRMPFCPFTCGNYTRFGATLVSESDRQTLYQDLTNLDVTTVYIWSDLNWPSAVEGIVNMVRTFG